MMYLDLQENIFSLSDRYMVVGESEVVQSAVFRDFFENVCEDRVVVGINYSSAEERCFNQLCRDCGIQSLICRIDRRILDSFELVDWYYLIERCYSDGKGDGIKAYLRFLHKVLQNIPGESSFINLHRKMDSVKETLNQLEELRLRGFITKEKSESLKIEYLEVMSVAEYLDDIISQIENLDCQSRLYWCLVRREIRSLKSAIPIFINHHMGDDLEIIRDVILDSRLRKIVFVSRDVFADSKGREFVNLFPTQFYGRISYLSSAKVVEELFGLIKKPKVTYSEIYDRRIGNNKWIDRLMKTNKTETYATSYEYEPFFSKEEISMLEQDVCLFICPKERGYVRCRI